MYRVFCTDFVTKPVINNVICILRYCNKNIFSTFRDKALHNISFYFMKYDRIYSCGNIEFKVLLRLSFVFVLPIKNRSLIKLYNRSLDETKYILQRSTNYEPHIFNQYYLLRFILCSSQKNITIWMMPSVCFILKNQQYYRYDILWWLMNHVCTMFHYLNSTRGIYFLYNLSIYGIYCDQTYNCIAGTKYILDECINILHSYIFICYSNKRWCIYYIINLS